VVDQWALYQDDLFKIVLPPYSGLGVYGGIATGTVVAFLYARYKRAPFLRWTDIIAPGLFVMQAIARWGNFFNQELYGSPTTLPWGIPIECVHRIAGATFDYTCAVLPETTRFHPLFLYESLSGLLGALFLIWLGFRARKRLRPGDLLLVFFVWYGLVRFVLEAFREGNWTFNGVPVAQIVSLMFVIPALLILGWRHRPGHPTDDPATHPEVATWGAIGRPVQSGPDDESGDQPDPGEGVGDEPEPESERAGDPPAEAEAESGAGAEAESGAGAEPEAEAESGAAAEPMTDVGNDPSAAPGDAVTSRSALALPMARLPLAQQPAPAPAPAPAQALRPATSNQVQQSATRNQPVLPRDAMILSVIRRRAP
jgi:phosphatidylglycerol:prolipoprotein diacylglycerol transferase